MRGCRIGTGTNLRFGAERDTSTDTSFFSPSGLRGWALFYMGRFSQNTFPVWKRYDLLTVSFLPSTVTAALPQRRWCRESREHTAWGRGGSAGSDPSVSILMGDSKDHRAGLFSVVPSERMLPPAKTQPTNRSNLYTSLTSLGKNLWHNIPL